MDARSRIAAPERGRVDRQEGVLLSFAAVAAAAEACAAAVVAGYGSTGPTRPTAWDELFAHRAMFSTLNLAGCLAIMLWPAWRRAARDLLDAMYPGEDSFEAAFKSLAGCALVSVAMAACLGAAALSWRPALPRMAALQLVTALAGPTVLAFFAARTAALFAVVLRIYRAL